MFSNGVTDFIDFKREHWKKEKICIPADPWILFWTFQLLYDCIPSPISLWYLPKNKAPLGQYSVSYLYKWPNWITSYYNRVKFKCFTWWTVIKKLDCLRTTWWFLFIFKGVTHDHSIILKYPFLAEFPWFPPPPFLCEKNTLFSFFC